MGIFANVRAKALVCLCLLVWALATTAWADCTNPSNAFVRSLSAMMTHKEVHRQNVKSLMIELVRMYPERYSEIVPYISAYASLHDKTTVAARAIRGLCKIYGENLELTPETPPEKRAAIEKLRGVINQINTSERHLKVLYFEKVGLLGTPESPARESSARAMMLLKEVETIADNVERVSNPISAEELGKPEGMNAEKSFQRYLGMNASPKRKQQMVVEARELAVYYNKNFETYAGYARLISKATPAQLGYFARSAKTRADDRATFVHRVLIFSRKPMLTDLRLDVSCLANKLRAALARPPVP